MQQYEFVTTEKEMLVDFGIVHHSWSDNFWCRKSATTGCHQCHLNINYHLQLLRPFIASSNSRFRFSESYFLHSINSLLIPSNFPVRKHSVTMAVIICSKKLWRASCGKSVRNWMQYIRLVLLILHSSKHCTWYYVGVLWMYIFSKRMV